MKLQVCKSEMQYPEELGQLRDANALLGDPEALRARMAEDGYLFIRGFHPREEVAAARERILSEMRARGIAAGQHRALREIAALPELMAIFESPRLFEFFEAYFGEPALTFNEKWLRAVPPKGFTGIHYDSVYMGRGSARLHTVWTPFGDLPMQMGTLAVCVGSHKEPFQRLIETYGKSDVDRDRIEGGGWYSESPEEISSSFGGEWKSTDVKMGDVIIISMSTLHCSTRNLTNETRLSSDIRFQPASEPADERWYGASPAGHSVDLGNEWDKSLEQAKQEWGL